ncbi:olfactory receptor 1019-like [Bombina bombina]|uniref:olfactory receptor 1019-like n=1 Tax=Bombina bombina TaxID=8345 RepID=UPI00235AAC03|nr:olfactory receptor 1019-like [Bombina bombina]
MDIENVTQFSVFHLIGFSDLPTWNLLLLLLFIFSFLVSLVGNSVIILIIIFDSSLHNPMYLFLLNLSFLDICSINVTAPQVMVIFGSMYYTVSFADCISQVYFYLVFTDAEFFLLPVMAYDRYVAICSPLHYYKIMKKEVCILLAVAPWAFGFIDMLSCTILTSQLSYCNSHIINNFFCDLTALMKLSCSDTSIIELVTFVEGVVFGFTPFFITLTSYAYIILNVLKINSVDGRRKAFSTCSSHITVVILFYGTIICMYMRPSSDYSPAQDKLFAVFYTTTVPMLNPLIYTLRNRDIKRAILKVLVNKHNPSFKDRPGKEEAAFLAKHPIQIGLNTLTNSSNLNNTDNFKIQSPLFFSLPEEDLGIPDGNVQDRDIVPLKLPINNPDLISSGFFPSQMIHKSPPHARLSYLFVIVFPSTASKKEDLLYDIGQFMIYMFKLIGHFVLV